LVFVIITRNSLLCQIKYQEGLPPENKPFYAYKLQTRDQKIPVMSIVNSIPGLDSF
jgi:hypothetical protein